MNHERIIAQGKQDGTAWKNRNAQGTKPIPQAVRNAYSYSRRAGKLGTVSVLARGKAFALYKAAFIGAIHGADVRVVSAVAVAGYWEVQQCSRCEREPIATWPIVARLRVRSAEYRWCWQCMREENVDVRGLPEPPRALSVVP